MTITRSTRELIVDGILDAGEVYNYQRYSIPVSKCVDTYGDQHYTKDIQAAYDDYAVSKEAL